MNKLQINVPKGLELMCESIRLVTLPDGYFLHSHFSLCSFPLNFLYKQIYLYYQIKMIGIHFVMSYYITSFIALRILLLLLFFLHKIKSVKRENGEH